MKKGMNLGHGELAKLTQPPLARDPGAITFPFDGKATRGQEETRESRCRSINGVQRSRWMWFPTRKSITALTPSIHPLFLRSIESSSTESALQTSVEFEATVRTRFHSSLYYSSAHSNQKDMEHPFLKKEISERQRRTGRETYK